MSVILLVCYLLTEIWNLWSCYLLVTRVSFWDLWSCFSSSEYELSYASLTLKPQSYVDDLARMCQSPESSQHGLDRFESLAETKLHSYNLDKSSIVIIGEKELEKD